MAPEGNGGTEEQQTGLRARRRTSYMRIPSFCSAEQGFVMINISVTFVRCSHIIRALILDTFDALLR